MFREQLNFAFYIALHPFKGFDDIKYENKGSARAGLILLLILALTFIIKRQFTGFIVNFNDLQDLNILYELQYVIAPFFLWCIANWSVTTLMDGEGKFSEIVMVVGYALLPMILIFLTMTLVSNVITLEESAFFHFFNSFAVVWFVWLLFIGMMLVHQYTFMKTVFTMLLTLLAIGFILFIGLLFFSLIQQIFSFVYTIYQELSFR